MSIAQPSFIPLPHPSAGKPDDFIMRLSVQQYHDMVRNAILTDDDPVELLEGWLVVKMPKNPQHSKSTGRVQRQLDRLLPPGFFTRVQEPVTLADGEPEPDVVVARGNDDRYTDRQPAADDVPLVVEVADSSLERDRTLKMRSYARAGIAAYWIINLQDRQVEVYSEPMGHGAEVGYRQSAICKSGQTVALVLDGREAGTIAVDDLLP